MYLLYFLVFALVSQATAIIDCPENELCYGEPRGCDPDQDCETLFQFDQDGNLNVYLKNFNNQLGYVAFAVDRHPDNTVRHLFCLPHQGQRFGGITDVDGSILLIDKNETGYVETLGTNNFQCSFNVSDLPENFHTSKSFFVSRGIWKEDLIMETQQKQLFDIKDFVISYEEEYNVFVAPNSYFIGYPVPRPAKSSGFIEQIVKRFWFYERGLNSEGDKQVETNENRGKTQNSKEIVTN
uniref:DOMON domain-containing protein n=1 Tax=Caenorhabditis tropicalis TaxID=1561998 RepID=A0A1I7TN66_9PELO